MNTNQPTVTQLSIETQIGVTAMKTSTTSTFTAISDTSDTQTPCYQTDSAKTGQNGTVSAYSPLIQTDVTCVTDDPISSVGAQS